MKNNPIRYSSAVGELWVHAMFKAKYAHKIFDIPIVRACADKLVREACEHYNIRYGTIGFDDNHVHLTLDLGLRSKPEVAKLLRGYTGRKLLKALPWLKRKYFPGSGLWNPSYYMDGSRLLEKITKYVNGQKYGTAIKTQTTLAVFG